MNVEVCSWVCDSGETIVAGGERQVAGWLHAHFHCEVEKLEGKL